MCKRITGSTASACFNKLQLVIARRSHITYGAFYNEHDGRREFHHCIVKKLVSNKQLLINYPMRSRTLRQASFYLKIFSEINVMLKLTDIGTLLLWASGVILSFSLMRCFIDSLHIYSIILLLKYPAFPYKMYVKLFRHIFYENGFYPNLFFDVLVHIICIQLTSYKAHSEYILVAFLCIIREVKKLNMQ